MKSFYKILKSPSSELIHEEGNYPIQTQIPLGPPFEAKDDAKTWLKGHMEIDVSYTIVRFFVTGLPQNLVKKTKKDNIAG